ncbi:hypothetical protein GOB94_12150 [Granulicella sp. 5B5]|uniref:hypothetical protein n=1 Tax=Granulicella sp. 5B5 TaxID=1617967 RepID=UPI0015F3897A|nr:hypothetical protein [Granulicella sp. 5B5]QMV19349.1 hypothetical protein GOB94_12150 [Granulicella sp. 5B5]
METTIVRAGYADRHALQRYTTDGQPSTSTGADGDSFETRIVWDGPVLVFTLVEQEDGRTIHSAERWSVSEDGQTLKRDRRSSKAEGESVIVYQRVRG